MGNWSKPLTYRRSGVAWKGSKSGHAPRVVVLGGASTHLIQPLKNVVLSINLDQNTPKNAYF